MAAGLEILASMNITRVAQALQDQTTLPQPLLFYNRARRVQASDDEITMREKSYVYAADIIATDSRAQIRDAGEFTFETTRIAKIKHGFGMNEHQMQLLNRLESAQASAADVITFENYVARKTEDLITGIEQRIETMLIGMLLDGYSYNRLGIQLGGTWGMPAAYKVTAAIEWDLPATAQPITDLLALKSYAQRTHGEVFNRVTMSLTTLQHVIATTQFKDMYKAMNYVWNVSDAAIETTETLKWASPVGQMIGMNVEVYDGMYREHNSSGAINAPVRFLPENVVLLTNSNDDNGRGWDFGQGVIMETVVGRLGGTTVYGGFPSDSFGPVAYATQADPALNPPGIVIWAVDRGAPRKHRETCSAKITAWT
jgi:hypothetical protein